MPITQERFMNVVLGAKHIINLHRTIREIVYDNLYHTTVKANSVLIRSTDVSAMEVIKELLQQIQNIKETFNELNTSDMQELTAIILAEEIHFKRAGRKNQKARYYQTKHRRENGIMPRAPEAQLQTPHIIQRSTPLTIEDNPDNSIGFKFFQQQEEEKRQKILQDTIAKQQKENKILFGELDLDKRAEQEIELMLKEQTKTSEIPNGLRPTNYDPRVSATSTPTQEELNKLPSKPGEDLL